MNANRKKPSAKSTHKEEPKASVVVTVGWMLGGLSTFGAEVIGVVLKAVAWTNESMPDWLQAITSVLFLVALVSGVFTLIMTVVCHKVRPTPPPKPITRMMITIATMPLIVLVARALAG